VTAQSPSALDPTWFGLDLGGTKCLGIAWRDGQVVHELREETDTADSDDVVALLQRVAEKLSEALGAASGIGVGAPGLVSRQGELALAPNLPGVKDLDLKAALEARVDSPVVVDNDAAAAAWGEFRAGAGVGVESMLAVTLGTGVGGGIVLGGQLVRGANGFAAEIGHIPFEENGRDCACGKQGCWEAYASGTALGALGRERLGGEVSGEDVTARAAAGDVAAVEVMDEYARRVARGLGGLVEVLDPEMVVIGGGLVAAGDLLMKPLAEKLPDYVYSWDHRPPTRVIPAELGERAGAIGAALLAADRS
jgi:glucokinase